MTEGQVQGKWVLVRNNRESEITEFELAGLTVPSSVIYCNSVMKMILQSLENSVNVYLEVSIKFEVGRKQLLQQIFKNSFFFNSKEKS